MCKEIIKLDILDKEVTTIIVNGDTYRIASEISNILNYSTTNKMIDNIDDSNVTSKSFLCTSQVHKEILPKVHHLHKFINEDGLFEAILSSEKKKLKYSRKK